MPEGRRDARAGRGWLERAVLAVAAVAVVAVVGFLAIEAVTEGSPPDPKAVIHPEQGRHGAAGWIVPMTVTNVGDGAVEDVVFEARASVGGAEETSEVQLRVLPARTTVDTEVAFSAPPDGPITVRLVSQVLP